MASPPDEFSITGIHLDANFSGQSRISSSAISSRPVNENGLVIRWDINLGSTDEQKMVRPSARPVIPLDFYPLIGQIIMTWGAFEEMFTKFTGALVVSTAHDIKTDIERLNFKRKKELCRKLITKQFYESENVLVYLNKLLSDAAELYWRRNLFAHGRGTPGMKVVSVSPFQGNCSPPSV